MLGAIIEVIRWFSGQRWNPCGTRSSSPSMLFSISPVPGTISPQPSPLENDNVATLSLESITDRLVVPRRAAARPFSCVR